MQFNGKVSHRGSLGHPKYYVRYVYFDVPGKVYCSSFSPFLRRVDQSGAIYRGPLRQPDTAWAQIVSGRSRVRPTRLILHSRHGAADMVRPTWRGRHGAADTARPTRCSRHGSALVFGSTVNRYCIFIASEASQLMQSMVTFS